MLKEQDPLIDLIREWIIHPEHVGAGVNLSVSEIFEVLEQLILEHYSKMHDSTDNTGSSSRLTKYLPSAPLFFLPLKLKEALNIYDAKTSLCKRRFVPPTFKDIRHILNIAVINAVAADLQMVTFDADDTIYEDGGSISKESPMAKVIVELLLRNVTVSLVTAAGYPGQPERYEERLKGILEAVQHLPPQLVMGGECNYLFETTSESESNILGLKSVDGEKWKDGRGVRWSDADITELLDKAEKTLKETVSLLNLPARVLRKERACGIINTSNKRFSYENLEEIALTVQEALAGCTAPHCAFNGGNDVWVDVGNKALGISALQRFVAQNHLGLEGSINASQCLHVGDRFTATGNDTRARDVSMTAWISDPEETVYIMNKLLSNLDSR